MHDSEGSHKHKIQFAIAHQAPKAHPAPSEFQVQQEPMEYLVMTV